MKKNIYLILACSLGACSRQEPQPVQPETAVAITENEATAADVQVTGTEPETPGFTLKQFPTVMDMLRDAKDYKEEDKTLKLVAEKPLHIQVSRQALADDTDEKIEEMAKRDIVFVALQAFAQTDIESIQITSIPLQLKSDFTFGQYLYKKKVTAKITRKDADDVMLKYLGSTDYKKLFYPLEGGIYVTSDDFERLKHAELDHVFADLTHKQ
jgi:hypothetical protein